MTPHDKPSEVEAQEGAVLVNGPDGIAFAMTPAAARETSIRLQAASVAAERQADGADQP